MYIHDICIRYMTYIHVCIAYMYAYYYSRQPYINYSRQPYIKHHRIQTFRRELRPFPVDTPNHRLGHRPRHNFWDDLVHRFLFVLHHWQNGHCTPFRSSTCNNLSNTDRSNWRNNCCRTLFSLPGNTKNNTIDGTCNTYNNNRPLDYESMLASKLSTN